MMFGKVVEIGSVLWSLPRMGSIFLVLVEAIPGFVNVPSWKGVENFEVLVSGKTIILYCPLEWDREFLGFGKRPGHCVEEDILKQEMGN